MSVSDNSCNTTNDFLPSLFVDFACLNVNLYQYICSVA